MENTPPTNFTILSNKITKFCDRGEYGRCLEDFTNVWYTAFSEIIHTH